MTNNLDKVKCGEPGACDGGCQWPRTTPENGQRQCPRTGEAVAVVSVIEGRESERPQAIIPESGGSGKRPEREAARKRDGVE